MALTRADIDKLFKDLNAELSKKGVSGQLHLMGGAVMCIVFEARQSTQDLDGFFKPAATIRDAASAPSATSPLGS